MNSKNLIRIFDLQALNKQFFLINIEPSFVKKKLTHCWFLKEIIINIKIFMIPSNILYNFVP